MTTETRNGILFFVGSVATAALVAFIVTKIVMGEWL